MVRHLLIVATGFRLAGLLLALQIGRQGTQVAWPRPVRAALVWTEGPNLMELPAASLDAALSRVAAEA